MRGVAAHVLEKVGGQDEEALLIHRLPQRHRSIGIGEVGVVEVDVAGRMLALVDIGGQVLRDEPVEQHAQHIALEVPAIDAAAQVVRDAPDGLVQLCTFGFLRRLSHG